MHDPETLNYFLFEVDRPSGIPSLAQMILEGIEIPKPKDLSRSLKQLATSVMQLGPPELSEEDVRKLRYDITNLADDIREPRSKDELVAAGAELYEALANYYLRTNKLWSAKGKSIPRGLRQADADLCLHYAASFDELFAHGHPVVIVWDEGGASRKQGGISDQEWEIFKLAFEGRGRIAVLSDKPSTDWKFDYRFLEAQSSVMCTSA